MKKKVIIVALAVLLTILMIELIALIAFAGNESEEKPATEPVATTEAVSTEAPEAMTTEAAEATTEAAEEETNPALEDSVFDDEPEKPTEATEKENQNQNTGSAKPTKPKPTEPKPTQPKPTEPSDPVDSDSDLTEYERFQNMSPSEQQAYMDSFPSIEAFFEWYNAAKAAYEAANPPIEVGDETIDIGDIIEGKG